MLDDGDDVDDAFTIAFMASHHLHAEAGRFRKLKSKLAKEDWFVITKH